MNGLSLIFYTFGVFALTITLSGMAFLPEKYPFNWYEILGWIGYILAIYFWSKS